MQSKMKLLVPAFVLLLAVLALTFTLYKPAQTGPPWDPVPKLWGYVIYDKGCSFTYHDTVWVQYNGNKQFTLVYQQGASYKYKFEPVLGPEGDRFLWGYQGSGGCVTAVYEIYWEMEDIRQDLEFQIVP